MWKSIPEEGNDQHENRKHHGKTCNLFSPRPALTCTREAPAAMEPPNSLTSLEEVVYKLHVIPSHLLLDAKGTETCIF